MLRLRRNGSVRRFATYRSSNGRPLPLADILGEQASPLIGLEIPAVDRTNFGNKLVENSFKAEHRRSFLVGRVRGRRDTFCGRCREH